MFSVLLTNGSRFVIEGKESLLDAALRNKLFFPYSCRTGRCGVCRCKVISGSTSVMQTEAGLTDEERSDGWVLSCSRGVESDLVVVTDELCSISLPVTKIAPCRISQIERVAPDVVRVFLRLPPRFDFSFFPGQYIDVIGVGGIRRSYSLASADLANKVLELHIRAVDGGAMSEYWFKRAKVDDLLRVVGPMGTFFLRDTADIDLIFLATGTGIAPVKAILESISTLSNDKRPRSVSVFWGGRSTVDLYFDVTGIYGQFQYVPVLSRPAAGWSGGKGYVQDVLLAMSPDLSSATVYACGSDSMIHSARKVLVEAGLSPKRFYSDAFVCSGTNLSE